MPGVPNYRFVVHPQDEEGDFIVTCPAFPGLSAFGSTPEAALAEARVALDGFIASYEADGWPLPAPDEAPTPDNRFSPERFSGKFVVRLPKSVHARLAELAEREGVSLNQVVLARLASGLTA